LNNPKNKNGTVCLKYFGLTLSKHPSLLDPLYIEL